MKLPAATTVRKVRASSVSMSFSTANDIEFLDIIIHNYSFEK